jgi:hypothetical protein
VQELDIVGRFTLTGASGDWWSVLDIDSAGEFVWTETDCSTTTTATGYLWVDGTQLVMHVETWDRPLPWDTAPITGQTFAPPFRMRLSYGLRLSDLAIFGPEGLTATQPYAGRTYVQQVAEGSYLAGEWRGEAELQAVPAGGTDPLVILRDTLFIDLQLETRVDPVEGSGTGNLRRTVYEPQPTTIVLNQFFPSNYTCLSGCTQPFGTSLFSAGLVMGYGPYAGDRHMLAIGQGRSFVRNAAPVCP